MTLLWNFAFYSLWGAGKTFAFRFWEWYDE